MSLTDACGSIHQGYERVILVMTLEEDKIFLCVWLLYYVSIFADSRKGLGSKISMKSFFMEIIFSLSAFSSSLGKNTSIRSKLPTAVCNLRKKREEGVKSTCFMSKASQIIRSVLCL